MDPTNTVVCHNGKFELLMLLAEGFDVFKMFDEGARLEDTMMLSKVLDSVSKSHSLEECAKRKLGVPTEDKGAITDWIKAQPAKIRKGLTFKDAPRDLVVRRVMWDVQQTLDLFRFFKPRVNASCPEIYETERQLIFVCADIENYGVRVDVTRAIELRDQALKDIAQIEADLNALTLPFTITKKKKGMPIEVEITEVFNPGSKLEMVGVFNKFGIELKYKTKPKRDKRTGKMKGGGNWSFDEYAMMRYAPRELVPIIRDSGEEAWPASKFYDEVYKTVEAKGLSPRSVLFPLVLKLLELRKLVSTYYTTLIEDSVDQRVAPNGRTYGILHCKFNQAEATTGRFSSSDPNLQNMPRLLGPRECFVPRSGRVHLHKDFDQVEMRMFVHKARDRHMANALRGDIHRYVASRVYKKPEDQVTSEQRKRAKATGFGIIYGSGPATQAETMTKRGLPTTKAEASIVISGFHREFPSVRKVTRDLSMELATNGYVTNEFGRRYYIDKDRAYIALNYFCQGTPADLIKAAMVKIWLWLRSAGLWPYVRIILTIHDELVFEVPKVLVKWFDMMVTPLMENKTDYFVPITCSSEIVDRRWSEKHEIDEWLNTGPKQLSWAFARDIVVRDS